MQKCRGNAAYKHLKHDQRHMTKGFAKVFDEEVIADGFMRGGKNYVVCYKKAERDCDIAVQCLLRAGYATYRTTPIEIVRRLAGKSIPGSTDELDEEFEVADCYFIFDLFDEELAARLSDSEKASLVWFVKEAIVGGVPVILPTTNSDADLDLFGTGFGDVITQEFEVINGKAPKKK